MVDALFIGPHPDDIEICSGGLALSLRLQGYTTGGLDLTAMYLIVDKAHGYFSGTMTLDDGTVLQVEDLLGFAEYAQQSW